MEILPFYYFTELPDFLASRTDQDASLLFVECLCIDSVC